MAFYKSAIEAGSPPSALGGKLFTIKSKSWGTILGARDTNANIPVPFRSLEIENVFESKQDVMETWPCGKNKQMC